jgi:hypothetical protein
MRSTQKHANFIEYHWELYGGEEVDKLHVMKAWTSEWRITILVVGA